MDKSLLPPNFNRLYYSLFLLVFLGALDTSIIATALPTIVGDFDVTENISWVIVGYNLAAGLALPVFGKLVDKYGSSRLIGWTLGFFLFASILCGLAPTIEFLTFARALQGLGGAGIGVLPLTILTSILPERYRPRYMAPISIVWAVAAIGGPVLGGLLTDALGWRWNFWINVPIGLVTFILIRKVLPKNENLKPGKLFDVSTYILFIAASVLLVLSLNGLTEAMTTEISGAFPLLWLAGAALVLFFWRSFKASNPVIPVRSFTSRGAITALAIATISGANLFPIAAYVPSLLQMAFDFPGWLAGMAIGPMVLTMLGVSILITRRVGRTGRFTKYPVIGSAIAGLAMLSAYLFGETLGAWWIVVALGIAGAGLGFYVQLNLTLVQAFTAAKFLGSITSTVSVLRDLSSSVVSTIAVSIFGFGVVNLRSKLTLPAGLTPSSVSPTDLATMEPVLKQNIQDAYFAAYEPVFLNSAFAYVFVFALALTLPKIDLKTDRAH